MDTVLFLVVVVSAFGLRLLAESRSVAMTAVQAAGLDRARTRASF